jgi:putative addiction module killer protein
MYHELRKRGTSAHGARESIECEKRGGGVLECRINFGPGYRIYFGREGDSIVILLAGGTKQRQQQDIKTARARWSDYTRRKKKEQ